LPYRAFDQHADEGLHRRCGVLRGGGVDSSAGLIRAQSDGDAVFSDAELTVEPMVGITGAGSPSAPGLEEA
jgi:hypothetical protein